MKKLGLFSRAAINFVDRMMPLIQYRIRESNNWKNNFPMPHPTVVGFSDEWDFMSSSVCSGLDFYHRDFQRLCNLIGADVALHRKLWEYIFIAHHGERMGAFGLGCRGLGFGVGQEPLPAAFAALGCEITATDAPVEVARESGWIDTNQFAMGLSGLPRGRLSQSEFERLVTWGECDMRNIDDSLTNYDFCWSSCCLEHLGSLQAGMDFIVETVEKTLKIGGVALHTTELNLSSNDQTVDSGPTVLYRRRDFETLISTLRERGHEVDDFRISPKAFVMNNFVDTPPYTGQHLMLNIDGYATTSAGIAVRRGR